MSYAGTSKGGTAAILAAEDLRAADRKAAGIDAVDPVLVGALLPAAIDRVMGEAGLWDEEMAATALLQGGGDLAEAVHLLRAHRSTLPRLGSSRPLDPDDLELLRRVVPATREPLGPQLLGDTADYSARLLRGPGDDDPLPRTPEMQAVLESRVAPPSPPPDEAPRRYSEVLRHRELLVDRRDPSDPEPADLALHPVHLPASRSAILSAIATAETGGLVHLWYRSILGPDGYANEHVTLGDVRYGRLPVRVTHPLTGGEVTIGRVRITDCDAWRTWTSAARTPLASSWATRWRSAATSARPSPARSSTCRRPAPTAPATGTPCSRSSCSRPTAWPPTVSWSTSSCRTTSRSPRRSIARWPPARSKRKSRRNTRTPDLTRERPSDPPRRGMRREMSHRMRRGLSETRR